MSSTLTVTQTSDLILDPADMSLSGIILIADQALLWNPARKPVVSEQRRASGGIPPLKYESSDSRVATVDKDGVVSSVRSGIAGITVSDSSIPPQRKSYWVYSTVQSYDVLYHREPLDAEHALEWINSVSGKSFPTGNAFWDALNGSYNPPQDLEGPQWHDGNAGSFPNQYSSIGVGDYLGKLSFIGYAVFSTTKLPVICIKPASGVQSE